MSKFKFITTEFQGLTVIEPTVHGDDRGFFMETYNRKEFSDVGIDIEFVQDNQSRSEAGILRGLHFQRTHPQGKLVRVIKGAVFDVSVDLREGSSTFRKWFGIELSEDNKVMVYIPRGFAHGFLALRDGTDFNYKCTDLYHREDEGGLLWNDEGIGIEWPLDTIGGAVQLSERDKAWPCLEDLNVDYDIERYPI